VSKVTSAVKRNTQGGKREKEDRQRDILRGGRKQNRNNKRRNREVEIFLFFIFHSKYKESGSMNQRDTVARGSRETRKSEGKKKYLKATNKNLRKGIRTRRDGILRETKVNFPLCFSQIRLRSSISAFSRLLMSPASVLAALFLFSSPGFQLLGSHRVNRTESRRCRFIITRKKRRIKRNVHHFMGGKKSTKRKLISCILEISSFDLRK